MIVPHGFRLNQKQDSKRYQWLRDNLEITSSLSLPLDIFDGVKFHSEVLFFNVPNIKANYFLDIDKKEEKSTNLTFPNTKLVA